MLGMLPVGRFSWEFLSNCLWNKVALTIAVEAVFPCMDVVIDFKSKPMRVHLKTF